MNILKVSLAAFFTLCICSAMANNYIENNGIAVIEAEDFASQHLDSKRRWLIFSANTPQHNYADNDVNHYKNASQGKYVELLPDTRTNDSETLRRGLNFSNIPGVSSILTYPVYFNTAGTYYVWARAFSTGGEDNGIHIGLNGEWPSSGQRLQLCRNKDQWTWSSAQRVDTKHCGTPNTITLDIPNPGVHTIMISMREDGFELDKLLLTTNKTYQPENIDLSATIAPSPPLVEKATLQGITQYKKILSAIDDFKIEAIGDIPFYQHTAKQALAINAANTHYRNKYAFAEYIVTATDKGTHQLTLVTLSETDGESSYQVLLNGNVIATVQNPETAIDYKEAYFKINNVTLKTGDVIKVAAKAVTNGKIPEDGGTAYSRGRWRALVIGTQDQ
jgi:hypothetical protein